MGLIMIKNRRILLPLIFVAFFALGSTYFNSKILTATNDHSMYVSISNALIWVGNNGMCSHNPISDAAGFFWPGGVNATITAIYEEGLVWGGIVNNEVRVGGSTYRHGLQAGPILEDGTAANPADSAYRVYKVRRNLNSVVNPQLKAQMIKDYIEWPVDQNAPWVDVNNNGIYEPDVNYFDGDTPYFIGDEVAYFVSNDLDTARTEFLYGSLPLGLEMQTLVYVHNRSGFLGDAVFKTHKIINKSSDTITDMYIGCWTDDDLGDPNDDFAGCDTHLNMGYTYNGDNNDESYYGANPPAIAHQFLAGPIVKSESEYDSAYFDYRWIKGRKNLPMTSYAFYINSNIIYSDPDLGSIAGTTQMYNYLQGKLWNGDNYINPNTNQSTKFPLAGDPVSGVYWHEGSGWPGGPGPGDRRALISTGPFTLAPGDTQEVTIVIHITRGSSNILSVDKLKDNALEHIRHFRNDPTFTQVQEIGRNNEIGFELSQNYPNPFNPSTKIKFSIPNAVESEANSVKLIVYDILGKEISVLVDEKLSSGQYEVDFSGVNLTSGVYIYKLTFGEYSTSNKMMLLK